MQQESVCFHINIPCAGRSVANIAQGDLFLLLRAGVVFRFKIKLRTKLAV